jgi:hypothetical protein
MAKSLPLAFTSMFDAKLKLLTKKAEVAKVDLISVASVIWLLQYLMCDVQILFVNQLMDKDVFLG